jgi:hypothetical protein
MKVQGLVKENYVSGGALNPLDETNRQWWMVSAVTVKYDDDEELQYSVEGKDVIPFK